MTAGARIAEWLLPPAHYPRSAEHNHAQAVTVIAWGLVSSVVIAAMGATEFAFGGSIGLLLSMAAALVLLEVLWFRHDARLLAHVLVATQFLAVAALSIASAGRLHGVLLIVPYFAFMAVLLLPRRIALGWCAFGAITIVLSYELNRRGVRAVLSPDPAWVANAPYRVPLFTLALSTAGALVFLRTYRGLVRKLFDSRERERSFAELARAQELRIRTITDNLPALISYVDRDERYRFANAANLMLAGMQPGSMIGRTVREVVGESAYEEVRPRVAAALRGERVSFDGCGPGPDGIVHYRADYIPDPAPDGTIRGFHAMLYDVTELKLAEARASASERLVRTIVDNVPVAIAYLDPQRRYRFANRVYGEYCHTTSNEIVGRTAAEVLGPEIEGRVAPLIDRALAGETVDFEIELQSPAGERIIRGRYTPDAGATGRVHGVVGLGHDVTDVVLLHRELEHGAYHDTLTSLPNRKRLLEQAAAALARFERGAPPPFLLFFDLDGFKPINDTHGHDAGDAVLRRFGEILRQRVRAGDLAARLAGDEFVALLEASTEADARRLADDVCNAAREPTAWHGATLHVGASVGVAAAVQGDTVDVWLKRADQALYGTKRSRAPTGPGRAPEPAV